MPATAIELQSIQTIAALVCSISMTVAIICAFVIVSSFGRANNEFIFHASIILAVISLTVWCICALTRYYKGEKEAENLVPVYVTKEEMQEIPAYVMDEKAQEHTNSSNYQIEYSDDGTKAILR